MNESSPFAHPWWVNLSFFVPFFVYFGWRKKGLAIPILSLTTLALFAAAFGFVEAAVVVYLRAAVGLLAGYRGTLADVARQSREQFPNTLLLSEIPESLLGLEVIREAATMIMLVSVALLASRTARERCAVFLWTSAIWDIFYYAGLWATVRWPTSLLTTDVLFLIPVPWVASIWFPILVSGLTLVAVAFARKSPAS